jgi:predicted DNA-binding protein
MYEKQISLRIDKETYKKIEAIAEKNKRKFSDMARIILEENIEKYE